jgi:hypothetical protein
MVSHHLFCYRQLFRVFEFEISLIEGKTIAISPSFPRITVHNLKPQIFMIFKLYRKSKIFLMNSDLIHHELVQNSRHITSNVKMIRNWFKIHGELGLNS